MKGIILSLAVFISTNGISQPMPERNFSEETRNFFADLRRNDEYFNGDVLATRHLYPYKKSSSNHLNRCLDDFSKHKVFYKEQWVNGKWVKLDSIALSSEEIWAIQKTLRSRKHASWQDSLIPYARFLRKREIDSVFRVKNDLFYSDRFPEGILQLSRPVFLKNNSVAVLFWQRFHHDGYGTLSIYKKGSEGWKEFSAVSNWEGVFKIEY